MNKLIEGEKLRKRLENLSREELIELAINQKLKVDSIDDKVSRINIPTACRARELTIAADKKEELRVERMLDEVYLYIMNYVSRELSKIQTKETSFDIPKLYHEEEFKGWERVGCDSWAGGPIPSMRSAWEKAAEKLRGLGYTVEVKTKARTYDQVYMSLYLSWVNTSSSNT